MKSPHKLPPNRQRQQRRLQGREYLFQDYPKFAPNYQRFAVFSQSPHHSHLQIYRRQYIYHQKWFRQVQVAFQSDQLII